MLRFEDTPEYRKGSSGERLVFEGFLKGGLIAYTPFKPMAHPIDAVLVGSNTNGVCCTLEVKTKTPRKYYADTGVDIRSYEKYKCVNEDLLTLIVFVDAGHKKVYGNFLNFLMRFTKFDRGKAYWPLEEMCWIADLAEEECEPIKDRKSDYDGFEYAFPRLKSFFDLMEDIGREDENKQLEQVPNQAQRQGVYALD